MLGSVGSNHTKRLVTLHKDATGSEGVVEGLLPVGVIVILVALGALANIIGADGRDAEDGRPRGTFRGDL